MRRWWGVWFTGIFWSAGLGHAGSFLDIRPPVVEVSEVPGKTVKGFFNLKNSGEDPLPVVVEVEDGWSQQIGRPSQVSPSEWLALKIPKKLRIPPHSDKRIPYRIRVPDRLSGESLALVFFSVPSEPGPKGGAGIKFRHGIPIYLSARGTERVVLTVAEANVYPLPTGGLDFVTTLVSDGNAHVRPRGTLKIMDVFGGETETVPLEYGSPVFPGSRQKYHAVTQRLDWAPGSYRVLLSVSYGDKWEAAQTLSQAFSMKVSDAKVTLEKELADAH